MIEPVDVMSQALLIMQYVAVPLLLFVAVMFAEHIVDFLKSTLRNRRIKVR